MQRQILTYTLRDELGHDKLGRVFRAVDTRTMKPVVLRVMRVATLVGTDQADATRAELRRLLRSAATVAHPNLAAVLDITSWRDLEIVAWDDFGGTPLAGRVGSSPAVEALRWAIETASAISRAHSRRVPHGRISMANLLVGRDDGIRVLDLGVPRPAEIPYLVDRPEGGGPWRAVARDLPRLLRRDVSALGQVVREIVGAAPAGDDPTAHDRLLDRVGEAMARADAAGVSAATLHGALVDVARDTPAVQGRALMRPGPDAEPTAPTTRHADEDLPPFSLSAYQPATTDDRGAGAAPLRVWGAAAFEPEPVDPVAGETVAPSAPREPPVMTKVLLPPDARARRRPPEDDERHEPAVRRPTRLVALSVLLGIAIAVSVFALQNLGATGAPTAIVVPDAAPAPPTLGFLPPPTLSGGGAPPVAATGRPAGTLVVAASDSAVLVSVDGSRPEAAPARWDRVPAGQRVVRVFRTGQLERVDTVDVRPDLTTTRYYVLPPTARR